MVENKISAMYHEAIGFSHAGDYLKKVIYNNGANLLFCPPAYSVNKAFACELLLKSLCIINGIENKKIHELNKLFLKLPEDIKKQIQEEYDRLCEEKRRICDNQIELRSMDECLKSYDNAFVEWRYYYETSTKNLCLPWEDFEILIGILKRMVEKHLNL